VLRADKAMPLEVYAPAASSVTVDGAPSGKVTANENGLVFIDLKAGEHAVEIKN